MVNPLFYNKNHILLISLNIQELSSFNFFYYSLLNSWIFYELDIELRFEQM